MNICLIRPPSVTTLEGMGDDAVAPIGIAYLAATMEVCGHKVQVIDAPGEALGRYYSEKEIPEILCLGLTHEELIARIDPTSEVIGISCMFSLEWLTTRSLIKKIGDAFPEAIIVAGGEHITAVPEHSMETCPAITYAVLGEGEQIFADLVERIENKGDPTEVSGICYSKEGKILRGQFRKRIRELKTIPPPAWHLLPIDNYLDKHVMSGVDLGRSMPIMASRGCPYRCSFCSSPQMWGTTWMVRPPQEVFNEICDYRNRYRATNFDFYDLTMIIKRSWIIEFCNLVINSGIKITWQLPSGTRTDVIDAEITDLLYRSGCGFITYAPESGSKEMLKKIQKRISKKKMLKSMRSAVKSGLNVKASILLGFPGEKIRYVFESLLFIVQMALCGIEDISIFPFSPYPGSEFFNTLKKDGLIALDDDYYRHLMRGTAALPGANSLCYSEYSVRTLKFFCLFGTFLFYAISFLRRPNRFFQLWCNVLYQTPKTRLQRALVILRSRKRKNIDSCIDNTVPC
ncbi:MAG: B12-binding domain-containing radical SAM protein [Deltaproteobacteria bacterium]|nr:B12-binding domain-containing radical SAM protein [Deltaproteobacteria bacterium]